MGLFGRLFGGKKNQNDEIEHPDVSKLKAERNAKGLIKALQYKEKSYVRYSAAEALGDLGYKEAMNALVNCIANDDDNGVKLEAARSLNKLGWVPNDQGPVAAWFWRSKGELEKCAACGVNAIAPLLPRVIDRDFDAIRAYAAIGQPGLETLIAGANTIYQQYESITSKTHEINFSLDSDRQTHAMIVELAKRLRGLALGIGMFGTPMAEAYLVMLYNQVLHGIYSHPASGFLDSFKAVDVRQDIVSAFKHTDGPEGVQLIAYVLEKDPSEFVRWEAADVVDYLAEHSPERVKNKELENALSKLLSDMKNQELTGNQSASGRSRMPRYIELLNKISV